MRIILMGQAAFGAAVLKALLERGEEVVAVYTRPDMAGRPEPLKEAALTVSLPVFQPERMRDPEVETSFKNFAPDLGVMAFVTDIVPLNVLNCPRLGTIQYHPSLLPRHRGASAINWAIIKGETKTGLTIFWVDAGIDTGPILLQKEVSIDPDDTVGSLYFNKLFPLGIEALVEAVALVKAGKAPRFPQDESLATYEPPCGEEYAQINWSQPAQQVYNLIRGTNPQPGATTYFKGEKLKIFDSELKTMPTAGAPGEITEVAERGFSVAVPGGAILVRRVQPSGSPKVSAVEYASFARIKVGDRLGRQEVL